MGPQAIWLGVSKKRGAACPSGDCAEIWSPRAGLAKETCVLRMLETNIGWSQASGDKL